MTTERLAKINLWYDAFPRLYLVHGSRDDNVHLQHSMALSKALVEEGVAFKQQVRTANSTDQSAFVPTIK